MPPPATQGVSHLLNFGTRDSRAPRENEPGSVDWAPALWTGVREGRINHYLNSDPTTDLTHHNEALDMLRRQ